MVAGRRADMFSTVCVRALEFDVNHYAENMRGFDERHENCPGFRMAGRVRVPCDCECHR